MRQESIDLRHPLQQSVDATDEAIKKMDALGDRLEALLAKNRGGDDA